MNKDQFIDCLHTPEKLKEVDLSELTLLVHDFPYCQTLRIMRVSKLFLDKNILFDSELKTVAIYAGSRRILKRHIDRLSDEKTRIYLPDEEKTETKKQEDTTHNEPLKSKVTEYVAQKPVADRVADDEPENAPLPHEKQPETEVESATAHDALKEEEHQEMPSRKLSLEELKKIVEERIKAIEEEKKKRGNQTGTNTSKKKTTNEIIDNFIKKNPSISRPKMSFFDPMESAKESVVDKENIVSETLANIYMDQGHYEKAINIYKKLSLKYPEKSSYFAPLIEKAKKNLEI